MLKFKKIGLFLLGIILPIGINCLYNPCLAIRHGGELSDGNPTLPLNMNTSSITRIDETITKNIDQGSHKTSKKFDILHLPEPKDYDTGLGYVLSLIKITINRLLGILAAVALVYMLYCGFLVVSSGSNDNTAGNGKKGIRTAAIAIAGIGLSRLIVSAIFRFIDTIAKYNA